MPTNPSLMDDEEEHKVLRPYRGKKADAENQRIKLERGEIFIEYPNSGPGSGIGRMKMGDGRHVYGELPYLFDQTNLENSDISNSFIRSIGTVGSTVYNDLMGKLSSTNTHLNDIIAAEKQLFANNNTSMGKLWSTVMTDIGNNKTGNSAGASMSTVLKLASTSIREDVNKLWTTVFNNSTHTLGSTNSSFGNNRLRQDVGTLENTTLKNPDQKSTTSAYGTKGVSLTTDNTSNKPLRTDVNALWDIVFSNGTALADNKLGNAVLRHDIDNAKLFSTIAISQGTKTTNIESDNKSGTFTIVQGSNITLTPDATNDKLTIAAKDTTYSFSSGTNQFTVTPSGGSPQTVKVTPSINNATTASAGLMSAGDKTKLDGIDTGADVNQNAFSKVKVGTVAISSTTTTDTLELVQGSNITITPDSDNKKVTISSTDTNTTYTFTSGTNCFKVKPSNGIEQNVNVTPNIANNITGSGSKDYLAKFLNDDNYISNGPQLGNDANIFLNNKGNWSYPLGTLYSFGDGTNGFSVTTTKPDGATSTFPVKVTPSINNATTASAGLMSAADKTKLNGISGDNNCIAKFSTNNKIISGPAFVDNDPNKYLSHNGTWTTPINTTYAPGTGIALNSGTFSNTGILAVSASTSIGAIQVTGGTNGTSDVRTVDVLGAASAYNTVNSDTIGNTVLASKINHLKYHVSQTWKYMRDYTFTPSSTETDQGSRVSLGSVTINTNSSQYKCIYFTNPLPKGTYILFYKFRIPYISYTEKTIGVIDINTNLGNDMSTSFCWNGLVPDDLYKLSSTMGVAIFGGSKSAYSAIKLYINSRVVDMNESTPTGLKYYQLQFMAHVIGIGGSDWE